MPTRKGDRRALVHSRGRLELRTLPSPRVGGSVAAAATAGATSRATSHSEATHAGTMASVPASPHEVVVALDRAPSMGEWGGDTAAVASGRGGSEAEAEVVGSKPRLGTLLPNMSARLEYCARSVFSTALVCVWVFTSATATLLPGTLLVAAKGILMCKPLLGLTLAAVPWLALSVLVSCPLLMFVVTVLPHDSRVAVGLAVFLLVGLHTYCSVHPMQTKVACAFSVLTCIT